MPHCEIWIHAVWSTKNRVPILHRDIRPTIFRHIKEYAAENGILLDFANGIADHVHILLELRPTQSLSILLNLIKGESARWVNEHRLLRDKLQWQSQFWAESVSPGEVKRVREYIRTQEFHHARKGCAEDWEEMLNQDNPTGEDHSMNG